MTHVTCRLTAKNRDQLRNPTLGNRVWATFTFYNKLSDYSQSHQGHCSFSIAYGERKCAKNYNKWHKKFIFYTAISILLISNHNGLTVLFDKIASVYFIWFFFQILALEMASSGNQHFANCIGTLSFPINNRLCLWPQMKSECCEEAEQIWNYADIKVGCS